MNYQWQKDFVDIPDATGSTYTIVHVTTEHAGSYRCIVSNEAGSRATNVATLGVESSDVVITGKSDNVSALVGDTITITVTATGRNLSYQWRKNTINISGATSSSYTINNSELSDLGSYTCYVSNYSSDSTSGIISVSVADVPVSITSNPSSQSSYIGDNVTFSVTASGSNLTYQWQKNGSNIVGATSSSYSISSVTLSNNSELYRCVVSNSTNSVTSNDGVLIVSDVPVSITDNPVNDTIYLYENTTFSVTASGTNLTYQWQKNTVNIPGATASTYTISNAAFSDAGSYRCVVSNSNNSQTSSAGVLTVNDVPVSITSQPQGGSILYGQNITFSVTASGTSLTYQWQKDTVNIPGSTTSTYTISNAVISDAGSYRCVVSNSNNSQTSSVAVLTITVVPVSITSQPQGGSILYGENITFSVTASGTSLTYQWQKNTVNISGATSSSYSILSALLTDAGSYRCVVSNPSNSQTSDSAILSVSDVPVSITINPQNTTVDFGDTASFYVTATGSNLVYQWQRNSANIVGANESSYTIPIVLLSDDGASFRCTVSNSANSQTSSFAYLTVIDASIEVLSFKAPPDGPLNDSTETYTQNTPGDRSPLVNDILPDMRLYLDMTSSDMPWYYTPITYNKTYLSASEVRDGVDLAMKCWASVLPMFKYRFVDTISDANFRIKFRTDHPEMPDRAVGLSMVPTEVVSNPDLVNDANDNTIYIRNAALAVRDMDFINSMMYYYFKSTIRQRTSPHRIFHFLRTQKQAYLPPGVTYPFIINQEYYSSAGALIPTEWINEITKRIYQNGQWSNNIEYTDPGTPTDLSNPYYELDSDPAKYLAVTGGPNDTGDYPRLTETYFTNDILDDATYANIFGYWGFTDIVYLMQHEFAHTLLGGHDTDANIHALNTRNFIDATAEVVVDKQNAICKLPAYPDPKIDEITAPSTFSNLFYEVHNVGPWNMRGIFDRDADRLAKGSADRSWTGYPAVSYPVISGKIELSKSNGDKTYTDSWHTAQEFMGWPTHKDTSNFAAHDTQWFVTDVIMPSAGDKHIAKTTDNDWTANYIYTYDGTSWDSTVPNIADVVQVGNTYYRYNGSSWVAL